MQKREAKAINKLCVREILSLSFVCGAYFFEFRGRNLDCFVIAYNFNGKYAPEAGKTRMRTAFFTRATVGKKTGNPLLILEQEIKRPSNCPFFFSETKASLYESPSLI